MNKKYNFPRHLSKKNNYTQKCIDTNVLQLMLLLFQKLFKIFSTWFCSVSPISSERGRSWFKCLDALVCQVPHFQNRSAQALRTTLRDDTIHLIPVRMAPFLATPLSSRICSRCNFHDQGCSRDRLVRDQDRDRDHEIFPRPRPRPRPVSISILASRPRPAKFETKTETKKMTSSIAFSIF